MNRLLPVSEIARLLGGVNRNLAYKLIKERLQSYKIGSVKVRTEDLEVYKVSKTLLELLDGLEYSLDENGSICFGNEESYREFFRRTERMAEQYGNKENSN